MVMTIWNLGSVNVDHVYRVPRFVSPGETLSAVDYSWGLGGKGLNQSVAIIRSGGHVKHLGAIHEADDQTRQAAAALGIEGLWGVEAATGHAMIQVTPEGENCIVLAPGANHTLDEQQLEQALSAAQGGDWLLLQNETNAGVAAVRAAKARGLKICYAAAPFEATAVALLINQVDLLSVNEGELAQLQASMAVNAPLLVTLGPKGAYYEAKGVRSDIAAFPTEVVDTTGAGDTFLGAFLAQFDKGLPLEACLRWASAAAALQVSRPGAASAIPTAEEIELLLREAL